MNKTIFILLDIFFLSFAQICFGATILFPSGGGLGTGTVPVAGQIPVGVTGGIYTPTYLTAGTDITIAMAKETLKDILTDRQKMISIENIQKTVSSFYNISVSDLKSSKKLKIYVIPRQISMYLCRSMTNSSFPEIGEKFGGKDHSTVIHAYRQVEKRLIEDREIKNVIETLKNQLQK